MRTQWCREHIDETAEKCGLEKSTVSDVKKAAEFCVDHPEISDCSTHSIMALIRERNEEIQARAISSISKSLESGKHPITGKHFKKGRLTEQTIKEVLRKVDLDIRHEMMVKESNQNQETGVVKIEITSSDTNKPNISTFERPTIDKWAKIQFLKEYILKPEHILILEGIVQTKQVDDILAALYIIIDAWQE